MNTGAKTEMVLEFLREKICNDSFPNGQLPRETDLCEMLGVSRVTVRRALANLSASGIIVRRQRAGTFLREKALDRQSVIGIMMCTQGHGCSDLYSLLSEKLSARGFSTQVVSFQRSTSEDRSIQRQQQVLRLLTQPSRGIIVEGYVLGDLPCLDSLQRNAPVLFGFFDSPQALEASGVWFDYEDGAYQAARFMLRNGCRRPLLIMHSIPFQVRFNPINYQRHREKQIIVGFNKALAEAGLDGNDFVFGPTLLGKSKDEELIIRIMQDSKLRPDGILGSADVLLMRPLKEALRLKLKMPGDILFVGIGNTPWSSGDSIHPFSSVDLQLETASEKIVEQVLLAPEKRKDIFIKPKLVVRK